MKKLLVVMALVFMFVVPMLAFAGATAVVNWVPGQNTKIVDVTWVSDAAGQVWASLGDIIDGNVFAIRTVPAGGTNAPDDNYDVYIKDYTTSYNYFGTSVENRDTANTEMVMPTAAVPIYGTVGFSISGAGNVNGGDTFFYVSVPK